MSPLHNVVQRCGSDSGYLQRFESRDVAGLTDEKTIAQLASIRYQHNARGQVVIESKEEARKRGVKGPDRAEAVMLAFAAGDHTRGAGRCVLLRSYFHQPSLNAEYTTNDKSAGMPPALQFATGH